MKGIFLEGRGNNRNLYRQGTLLKVINVLIPDLDEILLMASGVGILASHENLA